MMFWRGFKDAWFAFFPYWCLAVAAVNVLALVRAPGNLAYDLYLAVTAVIVVIFAMLHGSFGG